MHSYSSDAPDRRFAPLVIAIIAIGLAFMFQYLAKKCNLILPWWVETPGVMLFFGALHWVYNNCFWRPRIFGFGLSKIPDCNGTWYGELKSDYNKRTTIYGMLRIQQTWSKIMVEFITDSSSSYSRMASMNVTPGQSEGLIYEYANEPKPHTVDTMHSHRGFASLKLSANGESFEGEYYTGRDRVNIGTMILKKISKQRKELSEAKELYSSKQA